MFSRRLNPLSIVLVMVSLLACSDGPTVRGTSTAPIYGGTQVPPGSDPSVVLIFGSGLCSGTVIAPRAVLTAAHCAEFLAPEDFTILFGDDVRSIYDLRGVVASFVHPSWGGVNRSEVSDLAILLLDEEAPTTPVPLVQKERQPLTGETARLVGFGQTEESFSGVKFEVTLPITQDIGEILFLESSEGKSACFGDSGGPLFIERDGVEVQAGVASFGGGQCGLFSGYSRLDGAANDWIQAILVFAGGGVCEEPDTRAPALLCPDRLVECGQPLPRPLASDPCGEVTTSCAITSGSVSSGGTATCDATDPSGNTSECSFSFAVVDTQPPSITTRRVYLGAPDHRHHRVRLSDCVAQFSDACQGELDADQNGFILYVTSNEAEDNGFSTASSGDGATCDDALIDEQSSVLLRAERNATGSGRVYRIRFLAFDSSFNIVEGTCEVVAAAPTEPEPVYDECRFCAESPFLPGICEYTCPSSATTTCSSETSAPVSPGVPNAVVAGVARDDRGRAVPGVTLRLDKIVVGVDRMGGTHVQIVSGSEVVTNNGGTYRFPPVQAGTFRLAVQAPMGYSLTTGEAAREEDLELDAGIEKRDFLIRRNWASEAGGARVAYTTGTTYFPFIPPMAIDGRIDNAWVGFPDPTLGLQIVVELPQPVDLTEVLAWTIGPFEVETSADGKVFAFAGRAGDDHVPGEGFQRTNHYSVFPPPEAAANVRYVKIRLVDFEGISGIAEIGAFGQPSDGG